MVAKLHIHLHSVHLEDADITELADFVGVEEFHAARAFVEVVIEGDATVPVLDGAVACPEGVVDWCGRLPIIKVALDDIESAIKNSGKY